MSRTGTVGIVGGMSWHATALYYRRLNAASEARWGQGRTVPSVVVTVRFADLLATADRDDWTAVADAIADASHACVAGGADVVPPAAFTVHLADRAVARAGIPLLHTGDALAARASADGVVRVGLIGTRPMLRGGRIADRLEARGLVVLRPEAAQAALDTAVGRDLAAGRPTEAACRALDAAIAEVAELGAEAAVLACTELPLLLPRAAVLPLVDGVDVHVAAALDHVTGFGTPDRPGGEA
jgi:aspartate racemase